MELRCPKCNSTDLRKVSLAYEEGRFCSNARTGIRGLLVGTGGPVILVGTAATQGTVQTAVSKRLSPPKKWSYLKLIVGLAVVSFVVLVVYIHSVMAGASISSSVPVKLYGLLASCALIALVLVTWRHNHSAYSRQLGQWNRSYLCERCGAVSQESGNS